MPCPRPGTDPLTSGAFLLLVVGLLSVPFVAVAGDETASSVTVLRWQGAIGPISAAYLHRGLTLAGSGGAALVVLELDTPGGLDRAMRQMVQEILASPIPVAVYVHPHGARAASAGVFILAAAHLAVMSPATSVGAAHPVSLGAKMDSTMSAKVTNDAVAFLEGLAQRRGRTTDWCSKMVVTSIAVPADSALAMGVIDTVVSDLPALLAWCDGRRVVAAGDTLVLNTRAAVVRELPPDFRERFLRTLTNPELAYIFMMLGIYGLFFELSRPGAVLPGVVGAISLVLAFLAFQNLPVNYAGVLLILLGVILLILEVKITSYGMLTVGALVSLLIGTVLLFPGTGWRGVPWRTVLPLLTFTLVFFLGIVGAGLRAQTMRHRTGGEALLGRTGRVTVVADDGRAGTILMDGELWSCRSGSTLRPGDLVTVEGREGLLLTVSPVAGDREKGSL